MKWNILYSEQAKEDLQSIYEYIANELLEPSIAAAQIHAIMQEINSLDEMPLRYRLFETEPWTSKGLRLVSVGKYIVLYLLDENKGVVNIVRIMYGGRDIISQLPE